MAVRVDQSAVEMVVFSQPPVRVCQAAVEFVVAPQAPEINCGSPISGTVGVSYDHTFPVTGGTLPFTFSISAGALPPGLVLDASSGEVTGTPTAAGNYPITVTVVDANLSSSSVNCAIFISPQGVRITLRGVKRTKAEKACEDLVDVPKLPDAERAL